MLEQKYEIFKIIFDEIDKFCGFSFWLKATIYCNYNLVQRFLVVWRVILMVNFGYVPSFMRWWDV